MLPMQYHEEKCDNRLNGLLVDNKTGFVGRRWRSFEFGRPMSAEVRCVSSVET